MCPPLKILACILSNQKLSQEARTPEALMLPCHLEASHTPGFTCASTVGNSFNPDLHIAPECKDLSPQRQLTSALASFCLIKSAFLRP